MKVKSSLILTAFLFLSTWTANAAIKCSATLTYVGTGTEHQVEVTLTSGEELIAIGYEKSTTTGARVRKSEVYAVISFGEGGHLILEIPNLRADLSPQGYLADKRTFDEIVTRDKIHTKSFNNDYDYTLEVHRIVPN